MTSCWKGVTDFTAMSGLEQAMWDITGKYYNCPVYQLRGGPVREAVRAYTWPSPYETPEECAAVSVSAAIQIARALEPYDLLFFEEPVP